MRFRRARGWATTPWLALSAAIIVLASALVALAVTTEDVTQHNGLSSSDASHLRFFVEHRGDRIVDAAKILTDVGAAKLLAVLALVSAAVLWWQGSRVIVAVAPSVALGLAAVTASAAKSVVGRARPPIGIRLVSETEPSFPSGHATDSTAFYVTLALILAVFVFRRPLARVATVASGVAFAGCVGISRLVLGVHWPTDVLAGWALGTISALTVVLVVVALTRMTPAVQEGAPMRLRAMVLLHARRTPGLRAV